MKPLRILLASIAVLTLAVCDYRVAGKLSTPYGSVSSDGKIITLETDTRGFAK